ncbi:SCO family protein [Candidatus Poribacteria bacterium]|jgi:protein SCO1|nr:SCO family protein [Candidatus Poribacteria bacterium]MBT5536261.1 SCO family protein [Candidatus Poribacteria bacterium]MBT5712610.1 SCO family protein [Candidatus Poribacteria bacterium]MBT7807291.1 SCO family protein [Candidatus Poribacteria bacterium]
MSPRLRARLVRALYTFVAGAACWGLAGCRAAGDRPEDAHVGAAPELTAVASLGEIAALGFETQAGEPASLAGLTGKPVLMSFIYTRCAVPNMCPLTTRNVARVQALLSAEERAAVKLVSLTFDPEYDTREVLRDYAKSYGSDLASWEFWRGSKEDTTKLMDAFSVWAKEAGGEYAHNMRSVILGPDGSLSRVLRDSTWDAEEAAAHLRELATAPG